MLKRSRRKKPRLRFVYFTAVLVLLAAIGAGIVLGNQPVKKQQASHPTVKESSTVELETEQSPDIPARPKPVAWLQNAGQPNKLPILMYHNVCPDPKDNNAMSPETFESDLQEMQAEGYYSVNAQEALRILTTNQKPSNKLVWLTFDDGNECLYQYVFPLLKKYHVHATAAIITGHVGQPGIVSEAQIKEMAASGFVDFVSHTVDHLDLATLSHAEQTRELEESKAWLDNTLHQNTNILIYPSGSHNAETKQVAQQLGYKMGLIRGNGIAAAGDNLFETIRIRMITTAGGLAVKLNLEPTANYNTANTNKKKVMTSEPG